MQRNNKLLSLLLSLAIAFGLWLYVVTFVSSEHTETIYNIEVVYAGESVLAERNLMITAEEDNTVNLTLTGSRSDLAKINNNNVVLSVDLTKVDKTGSHRLPYTIDYLADVPSNAFVEESKYPSAITITVDNKLAKDVPVEVIYTGSVGEGFLVDKENAALDYSQINVSGPAAVVERIEKAMIEVNLDDRNESLSESYRYTLCDAENEPVDVSMVTTNVAEVRMDLSIRRFEEAPLTLNVIYGGGATETTAKYTIEPASIPISGSEAMLAELTEINLGTIDFTAITEDQVLTFPIDLPDGVTNESGVTEAQVTITFKGLAIEEFTASQIRVINVPANMDYTLLNKVMKVTLRGPEKAIKQVTSDDILITVDLANAEAGASTVKATITLDGTQFADVGALGSYSVSVTLKELPEEVAG